MPVIDVFETSDGASGGADVQTGGQYTRTFLVEFDAPNGDVVSAILANDGVTAVPDYGDVYPSDGTSFVTAKNGEQSPENPCIWKVRVSYTVPTINPNAPASPDAPSGGSGGTTSPILSQKKAWRLYKKTVAVTRDKAGNLIANAAGDPFDPSFTKDYSLPELHIERTQSSFNPQWLLDYKDMRNHTAVTIGGKVFAAKTLRVVDIHAEQPAGQSGAAWQLSMTIRYDNEFHDLFVLNAGLRKKVGGVVVPILNGGITPAQPVPLGAGGDVLPVGAAPVFLQFELYDTVDYTNLRLDY